MTGLLYYNARYYDPFSARFTTADTVESNANGMDPYAYVEDNPLIKIDPTGHWGWFAIAAAVFVAAAVVTVAVIAAPVVTPVMAAVAVVAAGVMAGEAIGAVYTDVSVMSSGKHFSSLSQALDTEGQNMLADGIGVGIGAIGLANPVGPAITGGIGTIAGHLISSAPSNIDTPFEQWFSQWESSKGGHNSCPRAGCSLSSAPQNNINPRITVAKLASFYTGTASPTNMYADYASSDTTSYSQAYTSYWESKEASIYERLVSQSD